MISMDLRREDLSPSQEAKDGSSKMPQLNIDKRKQNIAICHNMDGSRQYHTEWSNWDRERQIWYYLYVEYKK